MNVKTDLYSTLPHNIALTIVVVPVGVAWWMVSVKRPLSGHCCARSVAAVWDLRGALLANLVKLSTALVLKDLLSWTVQHVVMWMSAS